MNEIVALLESLRPILERWYLLLFAIVLVTLLGIPARVLVGALAALLRVPAVFTRAENCVSSGAAATGFRLAAALPALSTARVPTRKRATSSIGFCVADKPIR